MPTFDRSQTLLWLQRALGRKPDAAASDVALAAPWQRSVGSSGDVVWTLPAGAALPATLALPAGAKAAWAYVSYESREAQAPALPVSIKRTLWRVVTEAKPAAASQPAGQQAAAPDNARMNVTLERVEPGTPLDTNALYLDQVTLGAPKAMRWALLEVALPPGAAVEASTWGLDLSGQPLERARHEPTPQGYAVPVEKLEAGGSVTLRHLVRFAQRGQFKLPPVRVHRMYQPEAKGVDESGAWTTVEVR
jgi:uncharacterized protein YfaS (alpha-2-macroglobulin family)